MRALTWIAIMLFCAWFWKVAITGALELGRWMMDHPQSLPWISWFALVMAAFVLLVGRLSGRRR